MSVILPPAIAAHIHARAERAVQGLWGRHAKGQNRSIIMEEMIEVARHAYQAGKDDAIADARRPLIPTEAPHG